MTVEARVRALEREHNDRAWLAHTTAGLVRTNKRVRLEELLHRRKPARRNQTSAEFWDIMRAHVIAAGGKVH